MKNLAFSVKINVCHYKISYRDIIPHIRNKLLSMIKYSQV